MNHSKNMGVQVASLQKKIKVKQKYSCTSQKMENTVERALWSVRSAH
jgi:hypothetical protein